MKHLAVGVVLAFTLSTSFAGRYEDGLRNLANKSFAKASVAFRQAAAEGVVPAERQLGFMYYKGAGVAQSDTEAVSWFERAAMHGDLQSQVNLGQMYENGLSVGQSDSRSAYWYRLAAEQDDRASQFRLGEIYYLGTGVPKDAAEAVKWWHLALRAQDQMTSERRAMIEAPLRKLSSEARERGEVMANAWLAARQSAAPEQSLRTGR